MIIRELLITEPDRGSGCAAHRALLIWVAALVCTILTCDTKFVVIFSDCRSRSAQFIAR
jgi:hypothetical protein